MSKKYLFKEYKDFSTVIVIELPKSLKVKKLDNVEKGKLIQEILFKMKNKRKNETIWNNSLKRNINHLKFLKDQESITMSNEKTNEFLENMKHIDKNYFDFYFKNIENTTYLITYSKEHCFFNQFNSKIKKEPKVFNYDFGNYIMKYYYQLTYELCSEIDNIILKNILNFNKIDDYENYEINQMITMPNYEIHRNCKNWKKVKEEIKISGFMINTKKILPQELSRIVMDCQCRHNFYQKVLK